MQPRAHTLANAITQRLAPRGLCCSCLADRDAVVQVLLLGFVRKIRCEDRCLVIVVSAVEDVVHGVEYPLGAADGAQLVEHKYLGIEHRAEDLHLRRLHRRVIGILNGLQQLAVVAEQARHALVANQRFDDSDHQVRFADTDRTHEQQASLLDGIFFHETSGSQPRGS